MTTMASRPNVPNLALKVPTPAWVEDREDMDDDTWDASSAGSRFTAANFTLTPSSDPRAEVGVSVMQILGRSGEPYTVPVVFAYMDLASLEPDEARACAAALVRAADATERARQTA